MHRFYLSPKKITEGELSLCGREGHHAANVLRVRAGERVAVLDGEGSEYMCDVASVEKNDVRLIVQQQNKAVPLPYRITLLQAMTKGKSMDFIIQKATELCVHRIKQCGSPWLPLIEKPITPKDFLARNERFDIPMAASLQSHTQHPREYVDDFLSNQGQLPKSLAVWVGPEGDFTPAEINDILTAGVHPITLGQVILRSETAAIYAVSALNYELQSPRG